MEEAGIGDLLPGREIGKRLQADIEADPLIRRGQGASFQGGFDADAHKPFTRRRPLHGGSFGDALERSVHHHLEVPKLGEDERASLVLPTLHVKAVVVLLVG